MVDQQIPIAAGNWLLIRVMCCALFAAWFLYNCKKISRGHLSFSLGALWSSALFVALLYTIWPALLAKTSRIVGTILPVNLLYLISIVFLALISFGLTLKSSKHQREVMRLAQELSLMKERIDRQNKRSL